MNQGKKPRAKTLLVGKKLMGKNLNENWHISTVLKRVCSVPLHHFRCLMFICSLVRNNTRVRVVGQQFKQTL